MSRPNSSSSPSGEGRRPPSPRQLNQKQDLIDRIRESADKLERDGSSRGDLKLISRAIRELRYAFKVFGPYRRNPKVTMFGSARSSSDSPAYQQAVEFGRAIAREGWMVITGAASGIMEAGHVGAGRENSMGLNILLPFEQEANPIIEGDPKLVHMRYFFTRKLMFVKECQAVVCLPGGFGTLDEALEVLTLLQTGKRDMMPLVLLDEPGGQYWHDLEKFIRQHLLQTGMICPNDLSLYTITHEIDKAVNELVTFYRVYHSMRYVNDKLVFRLNHNLSPHMLDRLNRDFSDVLAGGRFRLSAALPDERDEPELASLPRLVFRFDRRSLGRLRQLIDELNRDGSDLGNAQSPPS